MIFENTKTPYDPKDEHEYVSYHLLSDNTNGDNYCYINFVHTVHSYSVQVHAWNKKTFEFTCF